MPYASEKLAHQPDDNPPTKDVLSAADQNEIEGAFVESTGGKAAGSPPRPSLVVRWSDVPMAVVYACDEAEMAVVEADVGDEVCRYRLVTVEDWPATLLVTRINDGRVYQASATVGAFGDRTERAARLLEALEAQLKEFANKRKFE